MQKHICGQCEKEFANENGYLNHVCEKTNHKPTEPEFLGEAFVEVSKMALERGAERAKLEKAGKTREEAIEETRNIGKKVA